MCVVFYNISAVSAVYLFLILYCTEMSGLIGYSENTDSTFVMLQREKFFTESL